MANSEPLSAEPQAGCQIWQQAALLETILNTSRAEYELISNAGRLRVPRSELLEHFLSLPKASPQIPGSRFPIVDGKTRFWSLWQLRHSFVPLT